MRKQTSIIKKDTLRLTEVRLAECQRLEALVSRVLCVSLAGDKCPFSKTGLISDEASDDDEDDDDDEICLRDLFGDFWLLRNVVIIVVDNGLFNTENVRI